MHLEIASLLNKNRCVMAEYPSGQYNECSTIVTNDASVTLTGNLLLALS